MNEAPARLVLASGSSIRRQLLEAAGFEFEVDPARIDEAAFSESDPEKRALGLASQKALDVSARRTADWVLGSDQVFSLDGVVHSKPENPSELREQLTRVQGREHDFHCGFALARGGRIEHAAVSPARVWFHPLSPEDVDAYAATGEGIGCAGGYRLEEGGVQVIQRVEGSHFTVLGLPMFDLVAALRGLGLSSAFVPWKRSRKA